MHFLDTNLCIEVLRHHPPIIQKKLRETKEIGISTIVYGELCFGIALSPTKTRENRREQLHQFVSLVSIYPWDEAAAEQYAIIRAYLQKKGTVIGNMDLLIAAHAKSLGATLVTNNRREFARVPDLHIQDWSR
jgi:tRNA(fMet)-specific endonuclease VapC